MEVLQIIMAAIGTLGFSIYFRVSEKNVLASTLGGTLGFAFYLLVYKLTDSLFFANFFAAFIIYLYSELCARILKAPSNVFLVPGIIPLLPGGALYYTMYGIVSSNKKMLYNNGIETVIMTVGIATGIVVGTVIINYLIRIQNRIKKNRIKENDT